VAAAGPVLDLERAGCLGHLSQKGFQPLFGILLVSIILYVIAWNVTSVKLNRLIERIGDARVVATDLINPDVIK